MGKVKHTEYYELLGVQVDATPEQLKKAYRKTALRLHPDRGGDPEQFKSMKSAYDILSDPNKRKMYDKYGPEIIKMMEGEGGGVDAMYTAFAQISKRERVQIILGLSLFSLFLLLSPILTSLLWDGTAVYEWAFVFVPLWILQTALLAFIFIFMKAPPSPDDPDMDAEAREMFEETKKVIATQKIWGTFYIFLFFAFEILLSLRLPGHVTFSWYYVMIPMIVYEVFHLGWTITKTHKQWLLTYHPGRESVSGYLSVCSFWTMLYENMKWGFLRIATWLLAAARADDLFTDSWFIVAIPVFFGLFLNLLVAVFTTKDIPGDFEGDQNTPPRKATLFEKVMAWILGNAVTITVVSLAAAKLDGASFSSFAIWAPLFIVIPCFCCTTSCMVMCMTPENLAEAAAEEAARRSTAEGNTEEEVSEATRLHDPEAQSYNTTEDYVGEAYPEQETRNEESTAIVLE